MANVLSSLSLSTSITGVRFLEGGDMLLEFQLLEGSRVHATKYYLLKADGTGVYDRSTGAQIAPTTPAAFMSDAASLKARGDAALTSAASAGKVTL